MSDHNSVPQDLDMSPESLPFELQQPAIIEQLDPDTWFIQEYIHDAPEDPRGPHDRNKDGKWILRRSSKPSDTAAWQIDGLFYTLSEAKEPIPRPPLATELKPIYSNETNGAWPIGDNIFLKVDQFYGDRNDSYTSESATLEFIEKQNFSFRSPKLLHTFTHYEVEAREPEKIANLENRTRFLFTTQVPGKTLINVWDSLNEKWQKHYAKCTVEAIKEMAELKGNQISGVDGNHLDHSAITVYHEVLDANGNSDIRRDNTPETLLKLAQEWRMDCSSFVFHHLDLGPLSILVEDPHPPVTEDPPEKGTIGIIDWERTGYIPPGLILTNFLVTPHPTFEAWSSEITSMLKAEGFTEHIEEWYKWYIKQEEESEKWYSENRRFCELDGLTIEEAEDGE